MAPTLLGVAANHNFIAKFEAALCPMIKFIVSGTCLMSIWTPERLLEKTPRSKQKMDTVKLSQFVVDATEDDVQQAAEQEEFFLATVRPGDFLYVPPGCLSSMQAWLWHSVLIL